MGLRIAGEIRQATAAYVRDYVMANERFTRADAALVGPEDRNAADALAAAPLAGRTGTTLLLTYREGFFGVPEAHVTNNSSGLTGQGYVFGGLDAVPAAVVAQADAAAQGDGR